MLKPAEQFDIIKRGTVEILPEEDLMKKLEQSFKTKTPLKIKAGFDPTAPDIHIGHTVLLEKMRQFQDLGHEVIFIIGDFTGMIGDPTGRSEIRKPLTKDEVLKNAETYKEQVFKVLNRDKTSIVFNSEWLGEINVMDFARLGSMQTVARMLEREDFKKRFENHQDISIIEFYYPLIQAYDSVHLKADIELGGTDQKFNLLMGRTIQKRMGVAEQVVIMIPLLEGTDGVNKMSKSLGNYIGITETPKDMFGKIMSISDELMLRYYELLSRMSLDELKALQNGIEDGSIHPKKAKQDLAQEIVERYHGKESAVKARDEFEHIFREKGLPDEIPVFKLRGEDDKKWLPRIIKDNGLAKSTSEAMRLIRQGGVSIDGKKWDDPGKDLPGKEFLLKVGKRKFLKVVIKT
ncbi:MAG TPA: tyrosine--tRNA ligase [Nitrospirae bacterium]|nr:tyrosine--tRNA ligase [bacterium BMS3Bbin08]HDH51596.1 tyrosine--tRNA ligase [Nitrospirota bacterium]HDK17653.1 tyrosine--tRNA ligase [Nitrospirota bacterium]HDO25054.1 tyrosine--tRNA ligase [Nitrospirota bacterium]